MNLKFAKYLIIILLLASCGNQETEIKSYGFPKKFKEPYYFDITREPNKHLSFGGGIHYCLGAMLSKLETEIAITTLIKRIPNVKLKENNEYKWKQNITLRGLICLTVTIK